MNVYKHLIFSTFVSFMINIYKRFQNFRYLFIFYLIVHNTFRRNYIKQQKLCKSNKIALSNNIMMNSGFLRKYKHSLDVDVYVAVLILVLNSNLHRIRRINIYFKCWVACDYHNYDDIIM